MPLDFQIKQAAFQFGVDESTDPHALPLGALTRLENFVWLKAARIEKRAGVTALGNGIQGGGAITSAVRLLTRGAELCLANSTGLFSYSPSAATWRSIGPMSDASPTWSTLIDQSVGVAGCDAALSSSGLLVTAWTSGDPTQVSTSVASSDPILVQVTDPSTGAVLLPPTVIALSALGCMGVRVLIIGTKAYVLSRVGNVAPYSIKGAIIDLTTFAISVALLANDVALTSVETGWDAHVVGSKIFVAYNQTGPNVRVASFTTALAASTAGSLVAGSGCEMVSLCGTTVLYVLYSASGATPRQVKIGIMDPTTLAVTVAPVTVEVPTAGSHALAVSVCEYDASNCVISYLMYTGLNELYLRTAKVSNAAVVASATIRRTPWLVPLTRPFMLNGRCYQGVVDGSPTLPSNSQFSGYSTGIGEIEFSDNTGITYPTMRLVAKLDDITGGMLVSSAPRPAPIVVSATRVQFPMPFLSAAAQAVSNWRCGSRLVTLDVGATRCTDWGRSFTFGQETYISGSGLSAYDGRLVFDYGFFRAPQIDGSTTSAAGGVILAGTYLYATLQEYRSNAGVLHRSTPAIGVSLTTTGATSSNTLFVDGYSFTNKQGIGPGFGGSRKASNPTLLPMYRSVVGGGIYQRLSFEPTYNLLLSDATATFATFVDAVGDANIGGSVSLASRPALYTSSALPDEQPPGNTTMFYHADRLWVLTGDGMSWWYSKTFQDDLGVAPGFSASFRVVFTDAQTCGVSMDEKAIFFSPIGIKYILGLGPAKDGTNNDFSPPIRINTDAGCSNPRSVVSTPDGIMFLSTVGIYTLTRGLDLAWSGKEIRDDLALYPNITSAVLVAAKSEVRFTANAADGLSGAVFVYNYVQKQWSICKYLQNAAGAGAAIADACMYQGLWTFVTPAGQVYQESLSSSLDAGAYVPGVLETAWISAAGPIAFTAVSDFWLQGVSNSDHELLIEAAFDSNTTYLQNRLFRAGSQVTTPGPLEECKINIGTRRMCDSIRFRVTDSAPLTPGSVLGTGKGPMFSSLGIQVGLLKGGNEPAGKKG